MGRKGISQADVVRAYVSLVKQHRVPSPTNLRLELGTGSYSTIAQHLRTLAFRRPYRYLRSAPCQPTVKTPPAPTLRKPQTNAQNRDE